MRARSKEQPDVSYLAARNRNRATRACTQCRKARIRCVSDSGSKQCTPCRDSQSQCTFDERDGRKGRASVKSVEATLMERIRELERQLEERLPIEGSNFRSSGLLPNSDCAGSLSCQLSPVNSSSKIDQPASCATDDKADSGEPASSVVTKLMPSSIRFDMASGRVRYFGSTTHMNVLSKMSSRKTTTRKPAPHWPIALVVRDMGPDTHAYLMELFWNSHNSVIKLVDQEAFRQDEESGGVEFYSTFLHVAILATGYRCADKRRDDIQRLGLSGRVTSTIHETLKTLARQEIEQAGGIPSIQAFQLLSGLEFCCGNDDTGWMFSGICFRMVYDAGLHIDHASTGISARDVRLRHMVLWACLTADRLWSLYLGRPTTLKTSDIAPSCLSFDFGTSKSLETRIYEAFLQMMERVGLLCDLRGSRPAKSADSYLQLAAIGQQLRDWYAELPQELRWTEALEAGMPPSYHLLHAQYHAALILLHRPFVEYSESSQDDLDVHFKSICRNSCASSAEAISIILDRYRSRFDMARVYGTAVQHAGTAATAMMGEIVIQTDPGERSRLIDRLSSLKTVVGLMAQTYQGAELMVNMIDQFIRSVTRPMPINEGHSATRGAILEDPSHTTAAQGTHDDSGDELVHMTCSRTKRRTGVTMPFAPTPFGALSPGGLPFLPSTFLDGLSEDNTFFASLLMDADVSNWDDG